VVNVAIVHRISDLSSQAADGSTTAKVAMGLLHDTDCRVLFRQSTTEVAQAAELLQLTEAEAELLPKLGKGRALWKVGQHTAVVQHEVAPDEWAFCDTDARLTV
jgi:predicted HD phosphohydrolase